MSDELDEDELESEELLFEEELLDDVSLVPELDAPVAPVLVPVEVELDAPLDAFAAALDALDAAFAAVSWAAVDDA